MEDIFLKKVAEELGVVLAKNQNIGTANFIVEQINKYKYKNRLLTKEEKKVLVEYISVYLRKRASSSTRIEEGDVFALSKTYYGTNATDTSGINDLIDFMTKGVSK